MAVLDDYRRIVRGILGELAAIPYSVDDLRSEAIFDRDTDRYIVVTYGRDHDGKRVHSCVAHIDIVDGKLWVRCDNTDRAIARELVDAGIPPDHIVLGFKSPELRPYTGFAVA
jgi:hypothetical protein